MFKQGDIQITAEECWIPSNHTLIYSTILIKQCLNLAASVPESILHHSVLTGPPTRARMVTLKYEWRLLTAELRQQSTSLNRTETNINAIPSVSLCFF